MTTASRMDRRYGLDERLARALDNAIGDGCCEETGDVEGPGHYALVRRSGEGRGGYIVRCDNYGFHEADDYATTAALEDAWVAVERYVSEFYEDGEEE